jgi:CHAT domain-containing protein/predicted negative regulator of RcsB-dependent stress response
MATGARVDQDLLAKYATQADDEQRRVFLAAHPALLHQDSIQWLTATSQKQLRVDIGEALAFAQAACVLAGELKDDLAIGLTLRAKGNALYIMGQNKAATEAHAAALKLFEAAGNTSETARTLNALIQPLTLLGDYEGAQAAGGKARELFTRLGDSVRVTRVDLNLANILYRQDRFAEALAVYESALEQVRTLHDTEGIVSALHNIAVCLIGLNDFRRALDMYRDARTLCVEHGMAASVAQADYNIAWLYYLRGEYGRAIHILRETREACRSTGDAYHFALCHLDLSEIYLELNLSDDAAEAARTAYARFTELGMGYEAAKALTNQAIALSQLGKAFPALELFNQGRELFLKEQNHIWPSLVDLYQALVLFNEGRPLEARRACQKALDFFKTSFLPNKTVLCHLLMARLDMKTGDLTGASARCETAIKLLAALEAPLLNYQTWFLTGEIQLARGDAEGAYQAYQKARAALETLRSSLRGEELKIAFMKNKFEVYENLVDLALKRDPGMAGRKEALGYIEQAKSRTLIDLIFQPVHAFPAGVSGQSELVRSIRMLREELNWYYHRIEQEQLRPEERSEERLVQLQEEARAHENELLRVLRDMPSSPEDYQLPRVEIVPLEEIQAALRPDDVLVEYFRVRDRVLAAVVSHSQVDIVPVTLISRIATALRLLQFQLSKFRLGDDYSNTFQEQLLHTTKLHLRELYNETFAPIRPLVRGKHVVFVPHDVLHYVPMHALFDGEQYLIESYSVSYAPSGSLLAVCGKKVVNQAGTTLVLGVPSSHAPHIETEVKAVAASLPESRLLLGEQATQAALMEHGPALRRLHIAAHGYFRHDNPMFSGIRLGDSHLSLYDLYQLKLPAELVTLSGCSTGLNVVAAGDELLGLMRGFLYAGAQSLLMTLWDVNDQSTAQFMISFYRRLQASGNKAESVREAMLELKQAMPHPYYWAPFLLIGKA